VTQRQFGHGDEGKNSCPCKESNSSHSVLASHYTDFAIWLYAII